jgi:hypothetical protein
MVEPLSPNGAWRIADDVVFRSKRATLSGGFGPDCALEIWRILSWSRWKVSKNEVRVQLLGDHCRNDTLDILLSEHLGHGQAPPSPDRGRDTRPAIAVDLEKYAAVQSYVATVEDAHRAQIATLEE